MHLAPPTPEERAALFAILGQSFHAPTDAWEIFAARMGEKNLRVARVDGRVVGGFGVYRMGQAWNGRVVPMGGFGAVGVAPEERGRGYAAGMVGAMLRELRDAGVPLAALYASTQQVYRRVGFEQAGSRLEYALPIASIGVADRALPARRVTEPHDLLPLYRPGHGGVARNAGIWSRVLAPQGNPAFAYRVGDEGYVVFSQEGKMHYDLIVRDWCAHTAAAARRIWTLLADHRSLATEVKWSGPASDPMLALLPEATWRVEKLHRWMLRVVDLPAALRGRGWTGEGELHLHVRDPLLPENDGRWVLEVSGGEAEVRAGGRGELALDVRALAPLYSGLFDARTLAQLGWLEGAEPAVAAAARLFASPEPWMRDFF